MKPVQILIFSVIFIIGGFVIFGSLSANNFNPAAIPKPISTIEILPTQTPVPESPTPTQVVSKIDSKVQIIKATYGPPFGFYPTELIAKVDIPMRLEVYAAENGRGCMGSITIPEFTQDIQYLTKGETNVFEFTPTKPGEYLITCGMGMLHGTIIVK